MIEQYLGFDSDYIILGLLAVIVILFIMIIVALSKIGALRRRYDSFMVGKDAKSLEETLINRLDQVDILLAANEANEKKIDHVLKCMKYSFQKVGMIKYDAFNEMGGKLSFSLALLNEANDGFIMNAVHSREGCYTYIKEVIAGNSIIALAEEEKEALRLAIDGDDE